MLPMSTLKHVFLLHINMQEAPTGGFMRTKIEREGPNGEKDMLMLKISSAAKLVALAMASFMLASSTSAAPVLNPHSEGDSLPAIDCVKIQSDITRENAPVVLGEQGLIKIDVSGCDPSLVDTAQPWTVTLVNCEHHDDTVKLADLIGGADQKEYTFAVNAQSNTLMAIKTGSGSSTATDSPKFHIQVDATSKDGTKRLTGRTASFNFVANSFFQKRDDDIIPPVDGAAMPEIVSPVDGASAPEVVEADKAEDISPAATATPPATPTVTGAPAVKPAAPAIPTGNPPTTTTVKNPPTTTTVTSTKPPVITTVKPSTTPVVTTTSIPSATSKTPTVAATPSPSPSPAPAVIPNPTYPNTPLEIIDPSTLATPSGPNQAAPGDPAAPKVIQEPKKRPSSGEVFLKYAGAGSAILSTIGLGVGGLVGGIVGGTVGLLIGVSAALVNSLYYAPNVA
ncbi:hypothetical protein BKA57DRAFT_526864 [Linnemannia elongata]|nr:hypothetical protein BKA57DRAFT_526864 [Linnemannia elongata]